MSKRVELPLIEPLYSTYHSQGPGTATIAKNLSVRNWYLNQAVNLTCSRKFLNGFTSPEIYVVQSSTSANPYFESKWMSTEFANGYINPIIRQMLDNGFYVVFGGVDDFYIKGKSWYKQKHFSHDGLICGYDQKDKTYCIYAYDTNWIYRKFWISQKDFNAGRLAMRKKGIFTDIRGIKVKSDKVDFSPEKAYQKIKGYLNSTLERYSFDGEGEVYGIVVHEYIAEYVTKLYNGDIPYERMDRRVFRLIWEHKKVMLERIEMMEKMLHLSSEFSKKYQILVSDADAMRALYASHSIKRRDSLLLIIKKKLLNLMNKEKELLTIFVDRVGKELENETLEVSKR